MQFLKWNRNTSSGTQMSVAAELAAQTENDSEFLPVRGHPSVHQEIVPPEYNRIILPVTGLLLYPLFFGQYYFGAFSVPVGA